MLTGGRQALVATRILTFCGQRVHVSDPCFVCVAGVLLLPTSYRHVTHTTSCSLCGCRILHTYFHGYFCLCRYELVVVADTFSTYCVCHANSIFWELEDMIPFSTHVLYRCLWGWMGPPEVSLLKLFQGSVIRKASVYCPLCPLKCAAEYYHATFVMPVIRKASVYCPLCPLKCTAEYYYATFVMLLPAL